MLEKVKKVWKKQKHKKLKGFLIFGIFALFIIANSPMVKNVKGADNYSNYLENSAINIVNDKAMIFQETATSSNEYRNIFESDFLFPAKLSNEMFSAYSTDYTRYALGQVYMDNLDNDYAYANNNASETIYTSQEINNTHINIVNGTYKGINNNNGYQRYTLIPNADIYNSDWNAGDSPPHYSRVNQYPLTDVVDSIGYDSYDNLTNERLGLTTEVIFGKITNITVYMYAQFSPGIVLRPTIDIWTGSEYLGSQVIQWTGIVGVKGWISYEWINLDLDQSDIDNLEIHFVSGKGKILIGGFDFLVYSIGVNISSFINNFSVYNTDMTGLGTGIFNGEYSFTGETGDVDTDISWVDTDGSTSTSEAIIINELDSHKEVLKLDDKDIGVVMSTHDIGSRAIGTTEFWLMIDVAGTSFIMLIADGSYSNSIYLQTSAAGSFLQYNDGSAHNIGAYVVDTWHHIRIEWDCTDDWHIWIDEVSMDSGVGYDYYGNPTNMDIHRVQTNGVSTADYWLDAIDYSWSTGYVLNRNLEGTIFEINIEHEIDVSYLGITDYNPIYLDLYMSYCSNDSTEIITQIYNYDFDSWSNIFSNSDVNDFNVMSFRFNETGQYRTKKIRFRTITNDIAYPILFYTTDIHLNITYVKTNNLGYNLIEAKINRKTDGGTLRGYFQYQVKLYDGYMYYRYLEHNIVESDYEINWILYNYSEYLNSDLETLEIQIHSRYGLNTLDMDISNIRVEIWFNNEHLFEFVEQERTGSFDAKQYNLNLNYTSYNRNYLNITGVFGNYSYNTLAGIRCLQGQNDVIYNRFFTIPFFLQNLDVYVPPLDPDSYTILDEPPAPKSSKYWTYVSFRIIPSSTIPTSVGNWTVEFTQIEVEEYTVKFFYNPEAVAKTSLGDWSFKISEWKISFNFLRDGIVWVINVILLFLQFLLYLVVASLSFVFMFLGCYILMLLWNYAMYWLYIGICWVGWWLCVFMLWLWSVLVWIWANIIYPFLQWCYNVLLPMIMVAIIMVMAFMITVFIYVATLGSVDFWTTYDTVEDILWLVVALILEWVLLFSANMFYILMFILWYLINMGLIYFRYLYARARGNINRAEQLYYTFQIYIAPMVFIGNLIRKLLESTPEL